MEKNCILRLEYFTSDEEDIPKELDLLKSIGWNVVICDDFAFSTTRQEMYQIITLRRE